MSVRYSPYRSRDKRIQSIKFLVSKFDFKLRMRSKIVFSLVSDHGIVIAFPAERVHARILGDVGTCVHALCAMLFHPPDT
jgi:hypothetical protein